MIFFPDKFKPSVVSEELTVDTSLILTGRESGRCVYCYIIGLEWMNEYY